MAKKTSKKKAAPVRSPKKATTKTAAKAAKSSSAGKQKTTQAKAPSVKKADSPKKKTKPAAAAADKKKAPTAKSSATAAAAALAAVQQYQNNGYHHDNDETVEWTEAKLRKVKTGLKKKDYDHFRELLMEKRAEILGDVASIKSANSGGAGNLSNMPLHMADVGSDNYEQEFSLGLVEWERKLLNEIDNAIDRINNGTYGVCLESGRPIPPERLEIKPWAKYTIEVVRDRERRGLPT